MLVWFSAKTAFRHFWSSTTIGEPRAGKKYYTKQITGSRNNIYFKTGLLVSSH